jgi:hypothetical protein
MTTTRQDEPIVTRSYQGMDGTEVAFAIGAPYSAGGESSSFKCDYVIDLPQKRVARTVEGMDGLHALFLSVSAVRRWITEADVVNPALYRWEGADEWGDLGFTLPT